MRNLIQIAAGLNIKHLIETISCCFEFAKKNSTITCEKNAISSCSAMHMFCSFFKQLKGPSKISKASILQRCMLSSFKRCSLTCKRPQMERDGGKIARSGKWAKIDAVGTI